jgi:hypothetical protein
MNIEENFTSYNIPKTLTLKNSVLNPDAVAFVKNQRFHKVTYRKEIE